QSRPGDHRVHLAEKSLTSRGFALALPRQRGKRRLLHAYISTAAVHCTQYRSFMVTCAEVPKGILREDEIYKWIISQEGKQALDYGNSPLKLAKEMERVAARYSDLVKATEYFGDGSRFP